jgi:hypothetical protein
MSAVTKFGTHITAVCTTERMQLLRNWALLAYLRERLAGAV